MTLECRAWGALALGGLLVALHGIGCTSPPPSPRRPPATSALPAGALPRPERPSDLREEPILPPVQFIELAIYDLEEMEAADAQTIRVTGKLRNGGERPTKEISLTVRALDGAGNVVASAPARAAVQVLRPGASASFSAELRSDPAIRTFHVEAVAR